LLALAEIYDGGSRTKAACVGGVGLQTIRDWVLRFNAHGPEGLADRHAPGHPGKLNTAQREALAAMVESGRMPAIHGVVRWRLKDLAMWVWDEFRVSVSETTLSRILRALGYRNSRPAPAIMPRPRERSTLLQKRSPSA
jgi:transposase